MAAVIAALIGLLVLGALVYDITRLFGSQEPPRPPLARLRGRRAALEAAELRVVGLHLHHRVDQAAYQQRMSSLAHGRRTPARPASAMGGRHG
ncbi:hypothetical protein [Streptomyces shenzhenensis]|uniref:hypothetical protein n=1 Tax=Streptomyces shenzhenensis TaxID=943815 RepID=UPI001F22420D|nr:hypothetical protein [Streptomyces shenzhenensis]